MTTPEPSPQPSELNPSQPAQASPTQKSGGLTTNQALALGIGTHVMWGLFPLFFQHLDPAGAFEVIVYRAFWGLMFCLLVLAITHSFGRLRTVLRDRKTTLRLMAAGGLVVINWTVYVHAVLTGHTTDAALGYFINPLISVALGLLVLRESISFLQKVSLTFGAIAVIVLIIGLGRLPFISLVLPLTFGVYSLVKKQVADKAGPVEGMAIETASVSPFLLGYLGYLLITGQSSFHTLAASAGGTGGGQWWQWQIHAVFLVAAGVITMIPLFTYAKAAQGLPLTILGQLQYIGPIMQLLIGVFLFHEHMEPIRWAATVIIWIALAILAVDMTRAARKSHRLLAARQVRKSS